MFNLFRRYHYFFVIELNDFNKDKVLSKKLIKYITKYLKWRGRKIKYFEAFNKDFISRIVVGSVEARNKINRNCFIFLLELSATFKNPNLKVTEDYPIIKEFEFDNQKVIIYKIKKERKYAEN